MNIKRAKEEIIDSIEAYLSRDAYGEYRIPVIHQRPILLLGAPGIGKTQIMEQIASRCRIALLSYTITHHTRQSAIGLPFVSKQTFDGKEYTITEYTMSEIVASIYRKMEKTGLKEGILFIHEINCVSETLAPAMLQLLQYKSFGNHLIPPGWIIVAAGNPPEYNKSVREFDVVTMDRVKKIEVEPDFDAWKEYAFQANVHPAVISYLNAKPLHFYRMETTVDGMFFATPRGWEDLSRLIQVYEDLEKPVDAQVVVQYIQYPEIAKDFANYLELFYRYRTDYQIDEIFKGNIPDILVKKAAHASFDERLSLLGLLLGRCGTGFRSCCAMESYLKMLHLLLSQAKVEMLPDERLQPGAVPLPEGKIQPGTVPLPEAERSSGAAVLELLLQQVKEEHAQKQRAELLTRQQKESFRQTEDFLETAIKEISGSHLQGEEAFSVVKNLFSEEKAQYDQAYETAAANLEYAFDFLEAVFGTGQEIVMFLTELNASPYSLHFLETYDCERYYRYNRNLLYEDRSKALLAKIQELE